VDLPFTEFKWANFLRDKVHQELIAESSLAEAIVRAVQLANTAGAAKLPGFRGLRPSDQLPTLDEIQQRLHLRYGADDEAPDLPAMRKTDPS